MRKWRASLRAILAILPAIFVLLLPNTAFASVTLTGSWCGSACGGSQTTSAVCTYSGTWGSTGSGTVTCTHTVGAVSIQFSGLSYVAGNNGTLTYSSGSEFNGGHARGIIVMNTTGSSIYGTFTPNDSQTPDTPTPACTSGKYTAVGSWASTTLAVRLKINDGSAFPATGFRVDAPDPGNSLPTTPNLSILTNDYVDGYPGVLYYKQGSLSTLSTLTARITSLDSTGAPICYVSITLSTNSIGQSPTDSTGLGSGENGDSNGGSNCGFSLNPLHYLVCLFEPTTSQMQGWSGKISTIEGQPPVNIFTAGVAYVSDGVSAIVCSVNNTCGPGGPQNNQYPDAFQAPTTFCGSGEGPMCGDSSNKVDLLAAAGHDVSDTAWGQVYYHICEVGIWGVFLLVAYRTIGAAVGGK